jgi:hypothetical protein
MSWLWFSMPIPGKPNPNFKIAFPKTWAYLNNVISGPNSTHFGTLYSHYNTDGYDSCQNQKVMFSGQDPGILEYNPFNPLVSEGDFLFNQAMEHGYVTTHIDWNCIYPYEAEGTKTYVKYPAGSMTNIYGLRFEKDIHFQYVYPNTLYCDQFLRNLTLSCPASGVGIFSHTLFGSIDICIGS